MKKILLIIALPVLAALGFFFLQGPDTGKIASDQRKITDLPWIIETDGHGGSRVFGLNIGKSTLGDAAKKFSSEAEIGVFLDPDGKLTLEAYFDRTGLSGLQARIVLEIDATPDELKHMITQAIEKKAMPSNAWQFRLPINLKQQISTRRFISLSYMPKVDIDTETLIKRFGPPARKIDIGKSSQYWLYPEKGLIITSNEEAKEIFQYVRPDEFDRLEQIIRGKH